MCAISPIFKSNLDLAFVIGYEVFCNPLRGYMEPNVDIENSQRLKTTESSCLSLPTLLFSSFCGKQKPCHSFNIGKGILVFNQEDVGFDMLLVHHGCVYVCNL